MYEGSKGSLVITYNGVTGVPKINNFRSLTTEESDTLKLTHEAIANHLGTHREVITRMLRYFQSEGMVKLSRGTVTILNKEKLEHLQNV